MEVIIFCTTVMVRLLFTLIVRIASHTINNNQVCVLFTIITAVHKIEIKKSIKKIV